MQWLSTHLQCENDLTAVFWLFCQVWHCVAALKRNASTVQSFFIQFPTPVGWKLTVSLLTVHSLLLCLPCTVIYYSPVKGWSSIPECCFCSVPGHVLLVVVSCWNRSHKSLSEGEWYGNNFFIPFPWSTLLARRSRAVVFHTVPTGFPRNCYIRLGWSGKGRAAWSHTSLKTKSYPSWA